MSYLIWLRTINKSKLKKIFKIVIIPLTAIMIFEYFGALGVRGTELLGNFSNNGLNYKLYKEDIIFGPDRYVLKSDIGSTRYDAIKSNDGIAILLLDHLFIRFNNSPYHTPSMLDRLKKILNRIW